MSMRVYIKGMEMPTSCWDCYFQDCGNCRLNAHKVVDKCIIEDCIDEDCPLVPVPPHGRLIDADALIIDLMDRGVDGVQTDDLYEIQQAVMDAPTIIEAEEGE
jgi:hypothetical protein